MAMPEAARECAGFAEGRRRHGALVAAPTWPPRGLAPNSPPLREKARPEAVALKSLAEAGGF